MPQLNLDKTLQAAQFIQQTWNSGDLVAAMPEALTPNSFDEAYAIQNELMNQTDGSVSGWKLAVASDNQIQQFELKRALVGQLINSRCYEDGDHIITPNIGNLTIESEIGLRLSRDIAPSDEIDVSTKLIDAVTFNFEIVRSRFADRRAVGWHSFVADNAAFEALVIGKPISSEVTTELLSSLRKDCSVYVDDNCVSSSLEGADGVDPVTSLRHLVEHAKEYKIQLFKGQMVTTGAFCKPFDIRDRKHTITLKCGNYSLSCSV